MKNEFNVICCYVKNLDVGDIFYYNNHLYSVIKHEVSGYVKLDCLDSKTGYISFPPDCLAIVDKGIIREFIEYREWVKAAISKEGCEEFGLKYNKKQLEGV